MQKVIKEKVEAAEQMNKRKNQEKTKQRDKRRHENSNERIRVKEGREYT